MAMVSLVKAENGRPVPLSDIASESFISLSYLEQLVAGLRRHGLVKSYRGPGGGYILSKSLDEITIADILLAAEDSTPAKKNAEDTTLKDCPESTALWTHISEILHTNLQKISLRDVLHSKTLGISY